MSVTKKNYCIPLVVSCSVAGFLLLSLEFDCVFLLSSGSWLFYIDSLFWWSCKFFYNLQTELCERATVMAAGRTHDSINSVQLFQLRLVWVKKHSGPRLQKKEPVTQLWWKFSNKKILEGSEFFVSEWGTHYESHPSSLWFKLKGGTGVDSDRVSHPCHP